MNWVLEDDGFLDACCSRRLTFSFPPKAAEGKDTAFAIAADMIPCSDEAREAVSEWMLARSFQPRHEAPPREL